MAWTVNQRWTITTLSALGITLGGGGLGVYISLTTRLTTLETRTNVHEKGIGSIVQLHDEQRELIGTVNEMQLTASTTQATAQASLRNSEIALGVARDHGQEIQAVRDLVSLEVRRSVQATDVLGARLTEALNAFRNGMDDRFRRRDFDEASKLWAAQLDLLRQKLLDFGERLRRTEEQIHRE